uniref:Immunoglobulin I-set domain-containing protein n=1 Tax=Anopheles culicifacies TaxID=139723 RepID=A0A182M6U4_9DIPT
MAMGGPWWEHFRTCGLQYTLVGIEHFAAGKGYTTGLKVRFLGQQENSKIIHAIDSLGIDSLESNSMEKAEKQRFESIHTSRTGDKFETMSRNTGYTKYMSLKIRNVGPADFGSYRCVAKNSLGETDGLIKLDGN